MDSRYGFQLPLSHTLNYHALVWLFVALFLLVSSVGIGTLQNGVRVRSGSGVAETCSPDLQHLHAS